MLLFIAKLKSYKILMNDSPKSLNMTWIYDPLIFFQPPGSHHEEPTPPSTTGKFPGMPGFFGRANLGAFWVANKSAATFWWLAAGALVSDEGIWRVQPFFSEIPTQNQTFETITVYTVQFCGNHRNCCCCCGEVLKILVFAQLKLNYFLAFSSGTVQRSQVLWMMSLRSGAGKSEDGWQERPRYGIRQDRGVCGACFQHTRPKRNESKPQIFGAFQDLACPSPAQSYLGGMTFKLRSELQKPEQTHLY